MSRIGRLPIPVPSGVTVTIGNRNVTVQGPKGTLEVPLPPLSEVALSEEGRIVVTRRDDSREARSQHGLTRSLLANAVEGVEKGFSKTLEIVGVGYRAALEGDTLVVTVGYSHPVRLKVIEGLKVEIDDRSRDAVRVTVRGADKQKVGEMAARIRRIAPPEPYLGKGIRYQGEVVRRKAGKTVG